MMRALKRVLFLFLLFIPICVQAESGIENFYVHAVIKENGNITVEEYFYLNGEFNGMDRDILFQNPDAYEFRPEMEYYGGSKIHNGSGITLEEIRALPIDENFDFQNISGTLFKETSNADAGDYGVYTITSSSDGESYRIFLPDSKNEAFYLKYTLKNMAVVHDDVAEIYWNVIGDSLRESIGTLKIRITFPNNQTEFRVWAHGPLQGEIHKVSNQVLEAEVHNVSSYEAVDVRAVFDKRVVTSSTKLTYVTALDKILNYEEDMANQANYEREQREYQYQQKAYEEILYCQKYPNRSCYNLAKDYTDWITDEKVLSDLQKQLADLLILVVAKEEENAKEYTNNALEYVDYYWYERAMDAVMILENETLKNILLNQLDTVRLEIIENEEKYNQTAIMISIVLIAGVVGVGILLYIKCDKEIKVDFFHKYMRDFPDDFSPSTVEYLLKKELTDQSVTAEILYMVCQKKIFLKQIENKKDYLLEKNLKYMDQLNPKEKALVDFLFNFSNSVTLKSLKSRNSMSSAKKWKTVQEKMLSEALEEELYVNDEKKVKVKAKKYNPYTAIIMFFLFIFFIAMNLSFLSILLVIIFSLCGRKNSIKNSIQKKDTFDFYLKLGSRIFSIFILMFSFFGIIHLYTTNHFVLTSLYFYVALTLSAILLLFYTGKVKKRTKKGALAFAEWSAFKRFLEDFGRMDEKELPEVILWEKYLVYAVVLGCADKLSKTMQIKMEEMNIPEANLIDPFVFTHFHMISSSVSSSVRSARSYSSPSSSGGSWSSGSGGGGGFSSGGGFGGGGGGGGRF